MSTLAILACGDPTGTGVRPGGPTLLEYDELLTGTLAASSDTAQFVLDVQPGDTFVVFVGVPDRGVVYADVKVDGVPVESAPAAGPHLSTHGQPVGPIVAHEGRYTVDLTPIGPMAESDTVGYSIEILRPAQPSPPESLAFNTPTEAALTPYGDVDLYSVQPELEDMLRLYVYAHPFAMIVGGVTASDGYPGESLQFDASLGAWVTKPLSADDSAYTVHVRTNGTLRSDSLPYTVRLFRSNRAPETRTSVLVEDVLLTGESIDEVGDLDEFTFTLSDSAYINTIVSVPSGNMYDVMASIHYDADPTLDTSRVPLPPGSYRLRLTPSGTFTGAYSLVFSVSSPLPEDVPADLAVGDTITESGEPQRDTDLFGVVLTGPQRVKIGIRNVGDPAGGVVSVINLDMFVHTESEPGDAEFALTRGLDFAGPRHYRISVTTGGGSTAWDALRAYQLTVAHVDTALESGTTAHIVAGDSVVDEAINHTDDVDRFRIVGSAGTSVQVELIGNADAVRFHIFDPHRNRWRTTRQEVSEPVVIPASGELIVDVIQVCNHINGCAMPLHYTLRTH